MSEKKARTSKKETISDYLIAGVKPLVWKLYPVLRIEDTGSEEPEGFYAKLFINSPDEGTLDPDVIAPVISGGARGAKLTLWQFDRIKELFELCKVNARELPAVLLKLPWKAFEASAAKKEYEKFILSLDEESASKICFLLPPDLLFLEKEKADKLLKSARQKGIKIGITGYGEEYFPFLRITEINVDYVFFDPRFSEAVSRKMTAETSLAKMATDLGLKTVAMLWNGERFAEVTEISDDYPSVFYVRGAGFDLKQVSER